MAELFDANVMRIRPHFDCSPAAIAAGIAFLIGATLAGPLLAQPPKGEQAPLEMTFVDGTPQESGAIHDKLRKIISSSDDINFASPEEFLFSAQEFNITLDDLGSKQKRKEKQELLRRALRANNLEALVVYKRTGDELHLIVMGPNGRQLKHYRSPVKRSRITDKQAVKVLKKLFEVLIPKVREFRKKQAQREKAREATKPKEEPPTDEEKKSASTAAAGPLGTKITLSISPLGGRRSLTMNSPERAKILTHVTPFLGVGGRLDSTFGVLPSNSAAIGGTLFAHYGRFSTEFARINRAVKGTVFRAGGAFRYMGGLSEDFVLFAQLGAHALDVGLETNSIYVGSSYFALLGGPGLLYQFDDIGQLRIAANLVPTLVTSTNERAFGDGSISFGANGEARFTVYSFKPILLSAFYNLDLYQPTHQNPGEYAGPATGTDLVHLGGLSVGYQF